MNSALALPKSEIFMASPWVFDEFEFKIPMSSRASCWVAQPYSAVNDIMKKCSYFCSVSWDFRKGRHHFDCLSSLDKTDWTLSNFIHVHVAMSNRQDYENELDQGCITMCCVSPDKVTSWLDSPFKRPILIEWLSHKSIWVFGWGRSLIWLDGHATSRIMIG